MLPALHFLAFSYIISFSPHNEPGGREGGRWEGIAIPISKAETKAQVWEAAILDSNLSLPGSEPLGTSLILNQYLSKRGL